MKRIEEIIDLIEVTGDKCVILHKERGAYVIMKMDDYKGLVIINSQDTQNEAEMAQNSQNNAQISEFSQPKNILKSYNPDIKEFEVPEEDRFYTEPLEG